MQTIEYYVKLADHFERNGEFAHAAQAYENAVGLLNPSDMSTPQRLDGVSSIGVVKDKMDGKPRPVATLQSSVHDALVSAYSPKILEGKDCFIGFQCPQNGCWVVSYFARKQLVLEDCWGATGQPRVFLLVSSKTGIVAYRVPDDARLQLSYLLAHIGWIRVEIASQLYQEHQILSGLGFPALRDAADLLLGAIVLRSTNAWAYARVGETYRRIANGWSGSGDSSDPVKPKPKSKLMAESQMESYVFALLYYDEAISIAGAAPGAFWVRVHLGAAIINVRAFANGAVPSRSSALGRLLIHWWPHLEEIKEDSEGNADKKFFLEAFRLFTQKARDSLVEGLRGSGHCYPWATTYYGATFLFEAMDKDGKDTQGLYALCILGLLNVIDALRLQPSIIKDAFEPGKLYSSPFLEWGLLAFYCGQPDLAWLFTRSGMGRLFKSSFLPGLPELLGFQILITISGDSLKQSDETMPPPPTDYRWPSSYQSEFGLDLAVAGVQIPERRIREEGALIKFIEGVMIHLAEPMIAPVMPEEICLNTSLEMSLLQVYLVFDNFGQIIEKLNNKDPKDLGSLNDLEKLISKCKEGIGKKLKFPDVFIETKYSIDEYRNDLLGMTMTGRPTYNMLHFLKIRSMGIGPVVPRE